MGRTLSIFIVGVIGLLALPLLAVGGVAAPSLAALAEIPPSFLTLYQDAAAQRCPGLPWSVLAAIGSVESNHGRLGGAELRPDGTVAPPIVGPVLDGSDGTARILDTDRGRLDGDNDYDRAVGPMQFIPSTAVRYGLDASGDGIADSHNAIDAVHTAAMYLCASGAADADQLPDALLAYNRSTEYVKRVFAVAARYEQGTGAIVAASDTLIAMVLTNPRITIYEAGRSDIAAGRIDARVLTLLQMGSEHWTLAVSSLQAGHSKCVGGGAYEGCNVSNHWYGRGVDISRVDGRPLSATNDAAHELVTWALRMAVDLRPDEIGHPWPSLTSDRGSFSDGAHADHVHLGWVSSR